MTIDISDPQVIHRIYKNLSKTAKQRLVCAAVCGLESLYDQLNVECMLVAVNAETDHEYDEDDDY